MTIIENRTYTPTDPEWSAVIAELREGDEVEAWTGPHGLSGTLDGTTRLWVGCWNVTGGVRRQNGSAVEDLTRLTVTKLASREPSWAGARVVLDALWRVWKINSGGHYDGPMTHKSAQLISTWGPVTVLIDAEGRIPVDSVLSVNGVTREDLVKVLRRWLAADAVDAILAALGGAR